MAEGIKILAQKMLRNDSATPTAATSNDIIYVAPQASGQRFESRRFSQTLITSIIVCHQDTTGTGHPYTIRLVADSETPAFDDKQYLFYSKNIASKSTDVLSLGIGLSAGNAIYASAGTSDISITIFGTEVV